MRTPEIVIISDLHLGHPTCRARDVLSYFDTCRPTRLILLGDILDLCDGRPWFWSRDQQRVMERILRLTQEGVQVDYITGNHDRALARLQPLLFGGIRIADRLELSIGDCKYLVTHGNRFDSKHNLSSRVLRFVGGYIYDVGMALSLRVDALWQSLGLNRPNLATRLKRRTPGVRVWLEAFIKNAVQRSAANGYQGLICGHLHVPEERWITTEYGTFHYLNSGDWVEHTSALEFSDGTWNIYDPQHKLSMTVPNMQIDEEFSLAA